MGSTGLRAKQDGILNTLESALTLSLLSALRKELQQELEEAEGWQS